MRKHVKKMMTGLFIVGPLGATIWVIVFVGKLAGQFGQNILETAHLTDKVKEGWQPLASWVGVLAVLLFIYLVGVLADFWMFGRFFKWVDQMLSSLPGIKTVYESVRDLMKLFGHSPGTRRGRPVLFKPQGSSFEMLGIVTNEKPRVCVNGDERVVVFLPMGYMIGGPTVLARPCDLTPLDMSVETAMKIAITAHITDEEPNTIEKPDEDAEA